MRIVFVVLTFNVDFIYIYIRMKLRSSEYFRLFCLFLGVGFHLVIGLDDDEVVV